MVDKEKPRQLAATGEYSGCCDEQRLIMGVKGGRVKWAMVFRFDGMSVLPPRMAERPSVRRKAGVSEMWTNDEINMGRRSRCLDQSRVGLTLF